MSNTFRLYKFRVWFKNNPPGFDSDVFLAQSAQEAVFMAELRTGLKAKSVEYGQEVPKDKQ